jgi:hypothetical protein
LVGFLLLVSFWLLFCLFVCFAFYRFFRSHPKDRPIQSPFTSSTSPRVS